jgi:Reverse transcriptase (RNA-dependent DNA polymerase)
VDFGEFTVVEPPLYKQAELLPSQKISPENLEHLSRTEGTQLSEVLDRHSEVFFEVPGLCTAVQHEIPVGAEFKPKRLKPYEVPQAYQAEVSKQIQELLNMGFIQASTSPQASPLIVVLKSPDKEGHRAVRLAVDYRYKNKFTAPSVTPLEDIFEIIQQIGNSNFISLLDAKSGYHPCLVKDEDRWHTSFVCNDGQFEWTRTPFGMRSSGITFVRTIKGLLYPICDFRKSYVDDMAVHSDGFEDHLKHIDSYSNTMKSARITLGIKKPELPSSFYVETENLTGIYGDISSPSVGDICVIPKPL